MRRIFWKFSREKLTPLTLEGNTAMKSCVNLWNKVMKIQRWIYYSDFEKKV